MVVLRNRLTTSTGSQRAVTVAGNQWWITWGQPQQEAVDNLRQAGWQNAPNATADVRRPQRRMQQGRRASRGPLFESDAGKGTAIWSRAISSRNNFFALPGRLGRPVDKGQQAVLEVAPRVGQRSPGFRNVLEVMLTQNRDKVIEQVG